MTGFTYDENTTIIITTYATSGLGVIGSLFTVITFLVFRASRNVATSLIFSLALSDLCSASSTSFFWKWATHDEKLPCDLQGTLLMFGLCASVLWSLTIGMYMFLVLYKNIEIERVDKYIYLFHLFAWGYASVGAIVPLVFRQYGIMFPGNPLTWCWIEKAKSPYRLILYIPDTTVFFLLIILYGLIKYRLRGTNNILAENICNKMSIYLLTYALINFFAIVNRLQNYLSSSDAIFELYFLQFLTQPLQGFLNAIAYAWNEPAFVEHYERILTKFRTEHAPTSQEQQEQERLMSMVCYDDDNP